MAIAKITSKGQITLPKAVRDRLGLEAGDELEFVDADGEYRIRRHLPTSSFAGYRGHLKQLRGRDSDAIVHELRGHE